MPLFKFLLLSYRLFEETLWVSLLRSVAVAHNHSPTSAVSILFQDVRDHNHVAFREFWKF